MMKNFWSSVQGYKIVNKLVTNLNFHTVICTKEPFVKPSVLSKCREFAPKCTFFGKLSYSLNLFSILLWRKHHVSNSDLQIPVFHLHQTCVYKIKKTSCCNSFSQLGMLQQLQNCEWEVWNPFFLQALP